MKCEMVIKRKHLFIFSSSSIRSFYISAFVYSRSIYIGRKLANLLPLLLPTQRIHFSAQIYGTVVLKTFSGFCFTPVILKMRFFISTLSCFPWDRKLLRITDKVIFSIRSISASCLRSFINYWFDQISIISLSISLH